MKQDKVVYPHYSTQNGAAVPVIHNYPLNSEDIYTDQENLSTELPTKILKLEKIKGEQWKNIEGFPAYWISDHGRLYSGHCGRLIALKPKTYGYYRALLSSYAGAKRDVAVHVLVAENFITKPCNIDGQKYIVCHKNDLKEDNRASNLYWGTDFTNAADRKKNGIQKYGEEIHCAKLTKNSVSNIKKNHRNLTTQELADSYGVSFTAIYSIQKGYTWKHI